QLHSGQSSSAHGCARRADSLLVGGPLFVGRARSAYRASRRADVALEANPVRRPPLRTLAIPLRLTKVSDRLHLRRPMTQKRVLQVSATVVVICGAVGYLLASGISSGEYYKHVDEVMQNPQAWQGKRLQVHGRVAKGSIERRVTGTFPEYRFAIVNNGQTIHA